MSAFEGARCRQLSYGLAVGRRHGGLKAGETMLVHSAGGGSDSGDANRQTHRRHGRRHGFGRETSAIEAFAPTI